jgi:hypothetical protein
MAVFRLKHFKLSPQIIILVAAILTISWIPASRVPEDPAEQKLFYLRQGRIYTSGDYVTNDAVHGSMLAVVFAPPEKVWKAFVNGNKWKNRGIPTMAESMMLTEEQAMTVVKQGLKNNEDIYTIAGKKGISSVTGRRPQGKWKSYGYQYYDFPWPVSDRWMVIDTDLDETKSSQGIYRMDFRKIAGNIRTLKGFCNITPFEGNPNLTLFDYQADSHPGVSLPKVFIKWGVQRAMPLVVNSLRKESNGMPRKID